jgi:hypothetical protein
LSTQIKLSVSGIMSPSCYICWKSSIDFSSYWPILKYLASFVFHEKMCNCIVPGAIGATSAFTHVGFLSSCQSASPPVFLCLKSGYLAFTYDISCALFSLALHIRYNNGDFTSSSTWELW